MLCPKCGGENSEDSVFCKKCGAKMSSEEEIQKSGLSRENLNKKIKSIFNSKNNRVKIYSTLVVILCLLGGVIYFNNPIVKFKNDIENNNYVEATHIYNTRISGNIDKENSIKSYLKNEVDNTYKSFVNEKIDFEEAENILETIKSTGLVPDDVNGAIDKSAALNNSRTSFSKADGFLKNKDYLNAIKEYKKVIPNDKNYNEAKNQIEKNQIKYKEQVLKTADKYASEKDYDKAVSLMNEATSIMPNDSDFIAKLSVYAQQIQNEQLVIVDSAKIAIQSSEWKALYPDMLQAIIRNKSDKTIKTMKVGFLGFDSNGYPVKIKMNMDFSGGDYEFVGDAEDVNIVAGGTFGHGVGWELDESHGISRVLACVRDVAFYDGTTWENPYYEYWIGQFKEKPLI